MESNTLPRVSEIISGALEAKGMSIKDLSKQTGTTYEHTRRMVRGESIPSFYLLRDVCPVLGLDINETEEVAKADRIVKKHGDLPSTLTTRVVGLEPIERVWLILTEDQKQDAITMITGWARRNKH